MENKNLRAEQDWVDKNPQYYKNAQHQEDVKHNIAVNYQIRDLESQIAKAGPVKGPKIGRQILELKATLRHNPEYVTITCPPIPKTKDELVMEERGPRSFTHIVPGYVENEGIRDGRQVHNEM